VNHHDRLFKAVFGQPEHAIDHFRRFLPVEVVGALDLDTTTLVPGSFVDAALSELHTDLLFSVRFAQDGDGEALVYVLFEHQSTVDAALPFRLLRYMVRIWEGWLKTEGNEATRLPPIIPLVLYHGPTPWTAATRLSQLLRSPPHVLEAL